MRKITDLLTYEGGTIRPFILYNKISEPMILNGKLHFHVFGTATINGVEMTSGDYCFELDKNVEIKIGKNSGVLFHLAPKVPLILDKPLALPEPPEMMDEMTRQMKAMFDLWLKDNGLTKPIAMDDNDNDDELFEDDDELFDDFVIDENNYPFDSLSESEAPGTIGDPDKDAGETINNGEDVTLTEEVDLEDEKD